MASKKPGKEYISEKERFKGKIDKQENRVRAAEGKTRRKKRGYEPVSDQKSHEFH